MHFLEKAEAFIEHLTKQHAAMLADRPAARALGRPAVLHAAQLAPADGRDATTDGDPNQNYAFDTPALKALVAQFQKDLRDLDANAFEGPAMHFVPLSDIASSIQY